MNSGRDAAEARKKAAIEALTVIGEDLLGRATNEAPVDEGTLRGSGKSEVTVTPRGVSVEVSFSTVYAARQHEEVTWKHPKGGKSKYLEDPLKEMAPRYVSALAAAIRKAF